MKLLLPALSILAVANALVVPRSPACTAACESLSSLLGNKVVFSTATNFTQTIGPYFSAQEASLVPSCAVFPTSAEDVSLFVRTLTPFNRPGETGCQFAIKGGGHAPASGAANINAGITLDLSGLNQVTLASDRKFVSLGGGSRWGAAYDVLTEQGLAVPGGRNAEVGVGGFLTGGGISFFTTRVGFACDNVLNFEVVLANGTIVSANASTNTQLWKALRGGSNNFGIVTRFNVSVFPQSNYLGGSINSLITTSPAQITALTNLAGAPTFDPYVSITLTYVWSAGNGFLITTNLAHTSTNSSLSAPPPSIQPFLAIQPQVANTMRTSNVSDFIAELTKPGVPGLRNSFATTTFKVNTAFMTRVVDIWNNTMTTVTSLPSLVFAGLTFEPIPTVISSKSAALGGDSLGLSPRDGNMLLILISFTWTSASADDAIVNASRSMIEQVDEAAQAQGMDKRWKYLNYAGAWQDVFASYGRESEGVLRRTSREYDPEGVFQRVVPGGFKLFR
ncbi:oxidoreductase FAD-binding protein [Rutstroemia sp. NJR-2017a BBW]|nr:oxidoreductase FAD-binding protein [Rutstroemia sp. NJR-2017a BBW]